MNETLIRYEAFLALGFSYLESAVLVSGQTHLIYFISEVWE